MIKDFVGYIYNGYYIMGYTLIHDEKIFNTSMNTILYYVTKKEKYLKELLFLSIFYVQQSDLNGKDGLDLTTESTCADFEKKLKGPKIAQEEIDLYIIKKRLLNKDAFKYLETMEDFKCCLNDFFKTKNFRFKLKTLRSEYKRILEKGYAQITVYDKIVLIYEGEKYHFEKRHLSNGSIISKSRSYLKKNRDFEHYLLFRRG